MNIYTANINPETGIAYGYIAANALDSDLVMNLLDGGVDHAAQAAFQEWKEAEAARLIEAGEFEEEEDALADADNRSFEFWERWEDSEPTVEGQYEGVTYCSSWLGGALNFFIFKSPVITDKARHASPCVPNAGIIDTLDGDVTSYDVPPDWRREVEMVPAFGIWRETA